VPDQRFARLGSLHFDSPEISLLGSSPDSCIWAAELGLPYVFADFINPAGAAIARHYRENFCASDLLQAPRTSVAAWAICAPTDAEAERLSFSFRMMMTLLFRGQSIPVPKVEQAERFLSEEGLLPSRTPPNRRIITGSPARVREAIETLAREYEAEEILIVNIVHDHAARRRSYELIAEEFGIG